MYSYVSCHIFLVSKNQTQATEKQIRQEFDQLREFLKKEEETRLASLRQEEEEKKELVKKKSDGITRDILTFSQAVIAIENEIASSDALFLQVREVETCLSLSAVSSSTLFLTVCYLPF